MTPSAPIHDETEATGRGKRSRDAAANKYFIYFAGCRLPGGWLSR
jgi:hypothetical protein